MSRARALSAVRRSYERGRIRCAARAVFVSAVPAALVLALHGSSTRTGLSAAVIAASLGAFAFIGGSWARGAIVGTFGGAVVLLAPMVVQALEPGHCARCRDPGASLCIAACFAMSSLVGIGLARFAWRDPSRRSFMFAALATSSLVASLGCTPTGTGGAFAISAGLMLGSLAGVQLQRATQHARAPSSRATR